MIIEDDGTKGDSTTKDGTMVPLLADNPAPPGDDIVDLVDEMEDRVLHGKEGEAHREREDTDASDEAPSPEDVDPSGGKPV